jgi:hypothetical protein
MLEIQIRYDRRFETYRKRHASGFSGVTTVGHSLNLAQGKIAINNLKQFVDDSVVIICLYNTAASRQEYVIRRCSAAYATEAVWKEVKPNTHESSKVPLGVDSDPFFD